MRLLGVCIVSDMARPRREASEAETTQHVADAALGKMDPEPCLDHPRQVHTTPAHDNMFGDSRTCAHHRRDLALPRRCQVPLAAGRHAAGQPSQAKVVVAMYPIAQRLAIHTAELGGFCPGVPLQDQRQRKHAPGGIRIARPRCCATQIRPIQIHTRDRYRHLSPRIVENQRIRSDDVWKSHPSHGFPPPV